MADDSRWHETLEKKAVTYHIEFDARLFPIENVPARVNAETGDERSVESQMTPVSNPTSSAALTGFVARIETPRHTHFGVSCNFKG